MCCGSSDALLLLESPAERAAGPPPNILKPTLPSRPLSRLHASNISMATGSIASHSLIPRERPRSRATPLLRRSSHTPPPEQNNLPGWRRVLDTSFSSSSPTRRLLCVPVRAVRVCPNMLTADDRRSSLSHPRPPIGRQAPRGGVPKAKLSLAPLLL